MSVKWNCDVCGKDTLVNPPTKPILEEVVIEGKKQIVQKKVKKKFQDSVSGEVKTVMVPQVEDLYPRAYIIKLNVGMETIQRDVCLDCLPKIKPELDALWKKLEDIRSK